MHQLMINQAKLSGTPRGRQTAECGVQNGHPKLRHGAGIFSLRTMRTTTGPSLQEGRRGGEVWKLLVFHSHLLRLFPAA